MRKEPLPIVSQVNEEAEDYTPIDKGQHTLEPSWRVAEFERKRGFGVEAAYKEYRHRWTEYPKKKIVSDYPLHVDIELASICNLNCPMCYTVTEMFQKKVNAKLMDFELFEKIVDECAAGGVYSIRLSYRGESFLHKKILECVKYAKEKGIKEVSSLTNGTRLDEEMFTELMDCGMDWLTISFDGIGETYEKIRAPAKFDRAVEKIRNYKAIKTKANKVKPVIKIQSVLPAIRNDLLKFYEIFAPIADMVSTNPLIDYLQKDGKDQIELIPQFSCPQIYQRLTIGADGLVMMCANDEESASPVGDIKTQTIHQIWHGPQFQLIRSLHARHQGTARNSVCAKCYLPRKTYPESLKLGDREVIVENYTNRTQEIGT